MRIGRQNTRDAFFYGQGKRQIFRSPQQIIKKKKEQGADEAQVKAGYGQYMGETAAFVPLIEIVRNQASVTKEQGPVDAPVGDVLYSVIEKPAYGIPALIREITNFMQDGLVLLDADDLYR